MSYRLKSPLLQALSYQDLILNENVSTEGLVSDRILARLKDLILSISKTVLTNTRYFKDDFKRSEFQAYVDGHKSQLDLFLRSPAYQLPHVSVPVPEGLKIPYPQSTTTIAKLLASYNLSEIYQALSKGTDIISTYKPGDEDSVIRQLKTVIESIDKYDLHIVETEKSIKDMFSRNPIVIMTATEAFVNKEGMSTSCNQVLSFNNIFRQMNSLKDGVETINRKIDTVVTKIEEGQNDHPVPKDLLKFYGQIISIAGQAVDHFGLVLHEAQRVEHMFTAAVSLVLKHSVPQ